MKSGANLCCSNEIIVVTTTGASTPMCTHTHTPTCRHECTHNVIIHIFPFYHASYPCLSSIYTMALTLPSLCYSFMKSLITIWNVYHAQNIFPPTHGNMNGQSYCPIQNLFWFDVTSYCKWYWQDIHQISPNAHDESTL